MKDKLPVYLEADLVIVGGGAAGMAAAVAAARHGADVVVIERWPQLGGQGTMAHVNMWHTSDKTREVILGYTAELVERLARHDGIQTLPDFPTRHETYMFSPYWLALVHDEMARELGIRVLCYTPVVDVVTNGHRIEAVVVGTKQGLRRIIGKLFIDASGSGDVGAFAGCQTMIGREPDHKVQGMTQVCTFRGFDLARKDETAAANREMIERMKALRDAGELSSFGPHGFHAESFVWRWPATLALCTRGNPLDAEDLTRAQMDAKAKLPKLLEFFRREWPGCENLELGQFGFALGVRESRRVRGRHLFTGDDVRQRRRFDDAIGHGFWLVDIHDPEGTGHTTWYERNEEETAGTTYQLPYRMLVAADTDNLFLAGRCASADHEGMAGVRVQSHCHVMGQAAGTAAAMALDANVAPVDMDVPALQQRLIDDGVFLQTSGGRRPSAPNQPPNRQSEQNGVDTGSL